MVLSGAIAKTFVSSFGGKQCFNFCSSKERRSPSINFREKVSCSVVKVSPLSVWFDSVISDREYDDCKEAPTPVSGENVSSLHVRIM